MNYFSFPLFLVTTALPSSALAADASLLSLPNVLMTMLVACAFILFFLGIIKFMRLGDKEGDTSNRASHLLYLVLGIFVLMSIGGIVFFLQSVFFGENGSVEIPFQSLRVSE